MTIDGVALWFRKRIAPRATHHPALLPAVGFVLQHVEIAFPGDDGADADLLDLGNVEHEALLDGRARAQAQGGWGQIRLAAQHALLELVQPRLLRRAQPKDARLRTALDYFTPRLQSSNIPVTAKRSLFFRTSGCLNKRILQEWN